MPARCGICGESYSLGTPHHECRECRRNGFVPDCQVGYTFYPEGETQYWLHCSKSRRHQRVVNQNFRTAAKHLARLDSVLSAARTHQKLMANPAYQALRKLFR